MQVELLHHLVFQTLEFISEKNKKSVLLKQFCRHVVQGLTVLLPVSTDVHLTGGARRRRLRRAAEAE